MRCLVTCLFFSLFFGGVALSQYMVQFCQPLLVRTSAARPLNHYHLHLHCLEPPHQKCLYALGVGLRVHPIPTKTTVILLHNFVGVRSIRQRYSHILLMRSDFATLLPYLLASVARQSNLIFLANVAFIQDIISSFLRV